MPNRSLLSKTPWLLAFVLPITVLVICLSAQTSANIRLSGLALLPSVAVNNPDGDLYRILDGGNCHDGAQLRNHTSEYVFKHAVGERSICYLSHDLVLPI